MIQDARLIERLIRAAYFTPCGERGWGLPLVLWGPPGCGKSTHFRKFARSVGKFYKRLSPAEEGEGAFGVTPVPHAGPDGSTTLFHPPSEWVTRLEPGSILLIDDITCTSQYLQPVLLGVVLEKVIGDSFLGKGTRVFGAGNATEDVGGGQDLGAAQANRMGHLDVGYPTGEGWADWLLSDGGENGHGEQIDVAAEEQRVMAAWPAAYAWARGALASFAKAKAAMFIKPEAGNDKASRAWPSPRSCEYLARALAAGRVHGLSEAETDELMTAFVGAGLVGELRAHLNKIELPDPAELLTGKVKWQHDPHRLDVACAVLSSTTAYVLSQPNGQREALAIALWGLLAGIDRPVDLLVPAAHQLVKHQLAMSSPTLKSAAGPVLVKLRPALAAAGVRFES